jgi:hypothetical protein
MSDPRRLLDDPHLGTPEREALRMAQREGMPPGQRDQLWAALSSAIEAPPGAAPPGNSGPATNTLPAPPTPDLSRGAGLAAGTKAGASGVSGLLAGGVWKSALIGAGVMAAALGTQSYLSPSPAAPVASIARPAASAPSARRPSDPARSEGIPAIDPAPRASVEAPAVPAVRPVVRGAASQAVSVAATPAPSATTTASAATTTIAAEHTEEPPAARVAAGAGGVGESPESPAAPVIADIGARAREESAAVAQARQLLRSGDPSGALAALSEMNRRFGAGVLGQEREALAIEALWLSGQQGPAQARARVFVQAHPASVFSARLRELTHVDGP